MEIYVDFIDINDKQLLHNVIMPVVPIKGSIISLGVKQQEWIVEKIKWRVMSASSTVSVFLTPCLGVKTL